MCLITSIIIIIIIMQAAASLRFQHLQLNVTDYSAGHVFVATRVCGRQ